MATKAQTAAAFASKLVASCHNARTGAGIYQLHGHTIAKWDDEFISDIKGVKLVHLSWCNHYTQTTASHLNEILYALSTDYRVSYAMNRDKKILGYHLYIKDGYCYAMQGIREV